MKPLRNGIVRQFRFMPLCPDSRKTSNMLYSYGYIIVAWALLFILPGMHRDCIQRKQDAPAFVLGNAATLERARRIYVGYQEDNGIKEADRQ